MENGDYNMFALSQMTLTEVAELISYSQNSLTSRFSRLPDTLKIKKYCWKKCFTFLHSDSNYKNTND